MPNLLPFRDYDEKDVINLYAFSGSLPASKGTLVKVQAGWKATDEMSMLGDVGASFNNTVSERYGVVAQVAIATTGDTPLGMLLWDVKETDENGEALKFNPRKAAEMQVVLSGQAVPIVTRGIFLYNGVGGTPVAGGAAYAGANGTITASSAGSAVQIGKFLGAKDANDNVAVRIAL
jgi:predicted RecA/RadA family phage recombinase